jgi:4-amino-4-deoxy-L-arabinose transferase-like glycosyltransferase
MKQADLRSSWLIPLVTAGVLIRLTFLALAGRLEPFADESNYLYLGILWNRFELYSDSGRYLWPPGYPFLVSRALSIFGSGGVMSLKLFQVLCSAIVGGCTILLARRVFNDRAARFAGVLWCIYLPLIGFTHYLWPETLFLALFLPSLYLLLLWWQNGDLRNRSAQLLAASGVIFGLAILVKEIGLFLLPVLSCLILLRAKDSPPRYRFGVALLFFLAATVVITPWMLRNFEVYGRFVPGGATVGKNMLMGLNSDYRNIDYPRRHRAKIARANHRVQEVLIGRQPEGWRQSSEINVIDRASDNVSRGLAFSRQNPGFVLRSRLKRLADWSSPMSFFLRHYGLERYHGGLDHVWVRRFLIGIAVMVPVLVLVGAIPGLFLSVRDPSTRWFLIGVLAFFVLAGGMLNASTRYRIAVEPLLIVCAAGFYSGAGLPWRGKSSGMLGALFGSAFLLTLWALNWREVLAYLSLIW